MKRFGTFAAGMAVMLLICSLAGGASAAGGQVEFNRAGISLFGEDHVRAGESYTAPNGQQVPSVITYVDNAGGKTNYLSVRQISELLRKTGLISVRTAARIKSSPLAQRRPRRGRRIPSMGRSRKLTRTRLPERP